MKSPFFNEIGVHWPFQHSSQPVLLTAKNASPNAGHSWMLGAKSWLSARLLTQQGTGFHPVFGRRDGESSAAFSSSSSSPQIWSPRTNFWVGGTSGGDSAASKPLSTNSHRIWIFAPRHPGAAEVSASLLIPHLNTLKPLMLKFSPALQSQIAETLLKPWTTVGMRWGLPSSRTAAAMEVTAPWPFGTCTILVKSEVSTLLLTMTTLFLTPSCSPTALFPRWRNYHLVKYSHPLTFHCPSAMMHTPALPAYTTVFQNGEMFIHPS